MEEIEKSPEQKKENLSKAVIEHDLKILKVEEEIKNLAAKYTQAGLIPERYSNDALHIAAAVANNLDVLVSWNMQHIVKLKTVMGVNKINKESGYKEIMIVTPEEVIE